MKLPLNKICIHWTAGTNKPCNQDLNAYHYLIDANGYIYSGKHRAEDIDAVYMGLKMGLLKESDLAEQIREDIYGINN